MLGEVTNCALQCLRARPSLLHSGDTLAGQGSGCQGVGRLLCIQKYFALLETYFTSHSSSGKTSITFSCKHCYSGIPHSCSLSDN